MDVTVGTALRVGTADEVTVTRLLGEGAAGRVYAVTTASGEQLALKWFKPTSAVTEQWHAIEYLLERGAPDDRFLWPIAIVGHLTDGQFGYLMPLRPPGFLRMSCLAQGRDENGAMLAVPFVVAIDLCRQLAEAFLRLHAQGMCYRDISLGNMFFNPEAGDVLVADVDNVAVDDGTSRVRGTGRFMAPEIVADRACRTLPSTWTDRHSLAVLLFVALFLEHPLEGAKSDLGLRDDVHLCTHFGDDPVFCLDPVDTRNRPIGTHVVRYWNDVYPRSLLRLFEQAFTEGLHEPRRRIGESQWVRALTRAREMLGICPTCAGTVFYDPETPARCCWSCAAPLGTPLLLVCGRRRVVVGPHVVLYADPSRAAHSVSTVNGSQSAVLARATMHPKDRRRIGLHNRSGFVWTARYPDGEREQIAPGQATDLVEGLLVTANGLHLEVMREALSASA
ncbi:MAG: protein kinase domain-containing protein [Nocardioidaceae bacterium]